MSRVAEHAEELLNRWISESLLKCLELPASEISGLHEWLRMRGYVRQEMSRCFVRPPIVSKERVCELAAHYQMQTGRAPRTLWMTRREWQELEEYLLESGIATYIMAPSEREFMGMAVEFQEDGEAWVGPEKGAIPPVLPGSFVLGYEHYAPASVTVGNCNAISFPAINELAEPESNPKPLLKPGVRKLHLS